LQDNIKSFGNFNIVLPRPWKQRKCQDMTNGSALLMKSLSTQRGFSS